MTDTIEDLLFFKLKDLITEQSEGEWTDTQIFADAIRFANALRPMLAASPQGEGLSAHPAPIKPSADTGELRERVADAAYVVLRHGDYKPGTDNGLIPHGERLVPLAIADAILDLIQSERGK